jgi:hypothetical protein
MSDSRRTVRFTLETEKEKETIDRFAKDRGFNGVSNLAKVALYQYMKRYPIKGKRNREE